MECELYVNKAVIKRKKCKENAVSGRGWRVVAKFIDLFAVSSKC